MDTETIGMDTGVAYPAPRQGHVLVVDEDPESRERVANYLTLNDFRVTPADTGKRMMEILRSERVDLVALELTLRGEDGHQLASRLRETSRVPIIIVTSRAEEADRVMGLELGADDYVTKPFSMRELLARIRAVMRRYRVSESPPEDNHAVRTYHFAGWTLNVPLHTLRSPRGERVPISNGEFGLLVAFLGRPQRVLTRDQLLDLSRLRSTDVYDRAVDVQILRLRRKIEANPARPDLIKTDRGLGYRFCAAVTATHSSAAQMIPTGRSVYGPVPVAAGASLVS
ncbi:MAG: response regulator [Steroidobacteraceae bacterium]|jgi:two-component system OmpR family response regulator